MKVTGDVCFIASDIVGRAKKNEHVSKSDIRKLGQLIDKVSNVPFCPETLISFAKNIGELKTILDGQESKIYAKKNNSLLNLESELTKKIISSDKMSSHKNDKNTCMTENITLPDNHSGRDLKVAELFVWLPCKEGGKSYFGHVSLRVGNTYISWWPENFSWSLSTPRKIFNDYAANRVRTLELEIKKEGRNPEFSALIENIDGKAIIEWWKGVGLNYVKDSGETELYSGPLPRYNLFEQSCSSIVADALSVGLHDRSCFTKKKNITPEDIMRFAKKISINNAL